jgi:hypothetical protein
MFLSCAKKTLFPWSPIAYLRKHRIHYEFCTIQSTFYFLVHNDSIYYLSLNLRFDTCFRYIQSTCATSGEGLYEGLDWLSNNIANKVRQPYIDVLDYLIKWMNICTLMYLP